MILQKLKIIGMLESGEKRDVMEFYILLTVHPEAIVDFQPT
jgi:hypothetical protein